MYHPKLLKILTAKNESTYKSILKTTSLFGGVQVFNIIIQIVRSKIIALFLGTAGIGLMGLINTTVSFIGSLTNFGLRVSAVKNISSANNSEDINKIAITYTVLQRLIWITGTLGCLIVIIFSRYLSQIIFGNYNYTISFIWISLTLLFQQLTNGQLALMQGLRRLRILAKVNVIGNFLGLLISIPLYYRYGLDGIVPAIILTALSNLIITYFFSKKIKFKKNKISLKQTFSEGKNMMSLGFMISFSGLLSILTSYIVRLYINNNGGVDQVGLYTAGFALISTYTGLIFTAMGTDYYPRLSAISGNNDLCKKMINQQAEIITLIIAPIILIFLIFSDSIIRTLYSFQFIPIKQMIYWGILGVYFKGISWAIGYLLLAKGKSKLFLYNEIVFNTYLLILNFIGYNLAGLTGLGISFLVSYFLHLIQMYLVANKLFNFLFNKHLIVIYISQFTFVFAGFLMVLFFYKLYIYLIGTIFIAISISYSYVNFK